MVHQMMPTSSRPAARASSKRMSMMHLYLSGWPRASRFVFDCHSLWLALERVGLCERLFLSSSLNPFLRLFPRANRPSPPHGRAVLMWLMLACLLVLAGCASPPVPAPAETPPTPPEKPLLEPPSQPSPAELEPLLRPRSRWWPVPWSELPGWSLDAQRESLVALGRSCERAQPAWRAFCSQLPQAPTHDDQALRQWLQQRLQPYAVSSHEGLREGLLTGYFEPVLEARRQRSQAFPVPLYAPPKDLSSRKPYYTRRQLDTLPAARQALQGRELAWLPHALDLLILQIQGSGRLNLPREDGSMQTVRMAYAGHNDHPYQSVGKWLIEQGELKPGEASWPAIKAWALMNPERVQAMMWANPRYIFFREESLPHPEEGPKGAQGVPLSPGRSIAVDPQSIPYGTPTWLASTDPLGGEPLQRLVVAQDTGSAIVGAVRADYFAGLGETALAQAGRMKQALRLWVLWPLPGLAAPGASPALALPTAAADTARPASSPVPATGPAP
jgi:membrane-bound lytic murein transglycosylase A